MHCMGCNAVYVKGVEKGPKYIHTHIFAHNFLNIQPIFNPIKSISLSFPTIPSNPIYNPSELCKLKLEKWNLPLKFNTHHKLEWCLWGQLLNITECLALKKHIHSQVFWVFLDSLNNFYADMIIQKSFPIRNSEYGI